MTNINPTLIHTPSIVRLNTIHTKRNEFINLLHDCVDSGASIGFIAPLEKNEAVEYWQSIETELQSGHRLLLVALEEDNIAGTVQLSLCQKKNGLHRAEVEKLMVHTAYRQRGIGKMLMAELELLAKQHQRSLLVLDTRTHDPASALYRKCGFTEVGQIPHFALNSSYEYSGTTYFYKLI
ncbi:GNAT family N-acetyltransferase [Xenorhabdus szentirmaii]|uniref:Acetyltransferase n=1 Tax=Xenorhabdus szentirmaii DSM 16338 TaxID=1427518 RepID=W1IWS8_9GAMM|nr:GNAT family N-acetyltransferase [Xenorhabdus szentirmaii]PHM31387.1 GNAT family acetyltransferase [Xenorhabdus szentirmaii DSM 16338]CDL82932.1 Acetyltransferase [Xenorhabdus szentirmaii DSM 16338]